MINTSQSLASNVALARWPNNPFTEAWSYWLDAYQRGALYWHVLQQRSQSYHEHTAKEAPHVLKFPCEVIMDGRKLQRPVNYVLVRIVPPPGIATHASKRPFVIVDPRAGHGPGIGGFKGDSEGGGGTHAGHRRSIIGVLPARR